MKQGYWWKREGLLWWEDTVEKVPRPTVPCGCATSPPPAQGCPWCAGTGLVTPYVRRMQQEEDADVAYMLNRIPKREKE